MEQYSFVCNACSNYQTDKCITCKGLGKNWEPINKERYEKDPKKYMEHLILASSV